MISPVPSYDNIFLSDPGPIYTWPFPTIYLPNLVSYKTCFPQPFLNFSSTLVFNFFFSHFLKKSIMSQRSNSIGPFLAMFIVGTLNTSLSMNWPHKFLSYQRLECAWWDQSTLDPISTCMCDVTRQIFFFICLCLCLCLCRVLLTQFLLLCVFVFVLIFVFVFVFFIVFIFAEYSSPNSYSPVSVWHTKLSLSFLSMSSFCRVFLTQFLLLCVGVTRRIGRGVLTQITQSGPVTCFERRKLSQKDEKSKKKAFGEYLHWQTIKRTVNTFFWNCPKFTDPSPSPLTLGQYEILLEYLWAIFHWHFVRPIQCKWSLCGISYWATINNRGENCKNLINHTFFQKNISNFWKEKI